MQHIYTPEDEKSEKIVSSVCAGVDLQAMHNTKSTEEENYCQERCFVQKNRTLWF